MYSSAWVYGYQINLKRDIFNKSRFMYMVISYKILLNSENYFLIKKFNLHNDLKLMTQA